ncbi:MAG: inositol monophosphatase [Deltaproteobacteria bacterium]|nr:inositol monophosphatase [Deltaproteobacteria bacterium]
MSVLTPRLRGGAPGLPTDDERERLRALLCAMEDAIQEHVIRARDDASMEDLSHIESVTDSDTIYYIDRVSEEAILRWFEQHWPSDLATILVMEGLPDSRPTVFPADIPEASARFVCIVDPIDGTRGLMYDKRSAWVLAGIAPNLGLETTLADIEVAVMTELPVTKQRLVDQLSAVKGKGPAGVIAERSSSDSLGSLRKGERVAISPRPSTAHDLHHGYVSFSRFFPAGKELLARFEEQLHTSLYGADKIAELAIFEDQYICSGGQIYELCMGHDRMIADLRPLAHETLGLAGAMACHPYDVCTALILTELGGVASDPYGGPLRIPLDTTSPVAWLGYANPSLAEHVQPVLGELLESFFPKPG